MTNTYEKLAKAIIDRVRKVIGPVAIIQANTVKGLKASKEKVQIKGNHQKIISDLVDAYKIIMGEIGVSLAKKGAEPILQQHPRLKVPDELKEAKE